MPDGDTPSVIMLIPREGRHKEPTHIGHHTLFDRSMPSEGRQETNKKRPTYSSQSVDDFNFILNTTNLYDGFEQLHKMHPRDNRSCCYPCLCHHRFFDEHRHTNTIESNS